MKEFVNGTGEIVSLELRQRVRGVAVYVLLGIFVGLVLLVTILLTIALNGFGADDAGGDEIFSVIIYFVLLLGTLVAPALSGNAVNGDRDAGTLATTQVTLITTGQLIAGKFLAAWVLALAFLAAAVPFLVYAAIAGELAAGTIVVSILVLALELGVVAAVGVGLSAIIDRPLLSVVATYLVVAALSIGSLIAFTLGGLVIQTPTTSSRSFADQVGPGNIVESCYTEPEQTFPSPRFDYVWVILATNPYVVLADAVPTEYDVQGNPVDLFGFVKVGVRSAQLPPDSMRYGQECVVGEVQQDPSFMTARETIESTVPGWFVGLALHLVLAAAALVFGWKRTLTPAGRLPRGSRIA